MRLRVGVVGCGTISGAYFKNMKASPRLEVVACADQAPERAKASAAAYAIPRVSSPAELAAEREVDLGLNLTIPRAHAAVTLSPLDNATHGYTRQPFATTHED